MLKLNHESAFFGQFYAIQTLHSFLCGLFGIILNERVASSPSRTRIFLEVGSKNRTVNR